MQDGLQQAVAIPLALAERISVLWPSLKELVIYGNISCKSDAQVDHFFFFSYISDSSLHPKWKYSYVKTLIIEARKCIKYLKIFYSSLRAPGQPEL